MMTGSLGRASMNEKRTPCGSASSSSTFPTSRRRWTLYRRAFGLSERFAHESGQYAELETGGTTLAFAAEDLVSANGLSFRPNRAGDAPAGCEVAFVTGDVPAAYAHALAAGASPLVEPHPKPWGQVVAYVRDLNGGLVELCSEVAA